ncbi:hypothetical protein NIPOLPBK_04111 [Stenotrophomonas maltophilia]|jgi:hypothetical protein|nr:hypothetical protein DP16_460 [Stenotrophomonas maltophilia]QNG70864.1 hypothetical protein NIPOLPBK_04111 [Stenotrophomonas maltophilia]WBL69149.1 hypothetical protein SMAL454_29950 [Stenotrophomonas maltophilia]SNW11834.1 Uncharacterised protein [Stenotrophomonas maltophilia]
MSVAFSRRLEGESRHPEQAFALRIVHVQRKGKQQLGPVGECALALSLRLDSGK